MISTAASLVFIAAVVAASSPPAPGNFTCNHSLLPTFCDTTQSPEARVAELVGAMTLQEKISTIGDNTVPGLPRLGIPPYEWWGEALHGVCSSPSVTFRPPTPNGHDATTATSFPEPILTAASFNDDLFRQVGQVVGTEGRAMANAGNSGLTFWAPNINIVRDPRWGRLQETPGEDPFLTSRYAIRFVTGVQGPHPFWLRATSTCKHFASYNLDNWHGVDRYHFNAVVNPQDWADTYSQPFQACVVGANVSGLMCSYNAMNGIPTCANPYLTEKLARGTWGFDGYMTGDCGAAADVWTAHHYGGSAAGAVAAAVNAGMDQDCGGFTGQHAMDALTNCTNCSQGSLTKASLDKAVGHLYRLRLRLGYFDSPATTPYGNLTYRDIDVTAHHMLALQAAREGIVLLDNHAGDLPLSTPGVKSVAVIGPNADNGGTMQGVDCHGVPPFLLTPRGELAKYATVHYAQGCGVTANSSAAGFDDAIAAAKVSDAVILVMGIDSSVEYEMLDRTDLLLPRVQGQLVKAVVGAAAGKPVILVVMSGGVIDVSPQLAAGVSAVVWVGYPGQAGGQALAEILFGDVNPSGRAVHTWYLNEYASDNSAGAVNMLDMGLRPNASSKNPGRTHRFFPGKVLYTFGHGLQYSRFAQGPLTATVAGAGGVVSAATISHALASGPRYSGKPFVTVSVTVTNAADGARKGDHSVLFFAAPPTAGVGGDPLQSLVGYARTGMLAPGEAATVSVQLTAWELSLADSEGRWATRAGEWRLFTAEDKVGTTVKVVSPQAA